MIDRNKETKTLQRDETASQEFIRHAVEEHGAVNEVYIDGQTFNQLLRDRDIAPEDLFSRAPSVQDQLGDAHEFNGTIRIPTDEFVSAMSALDDATPFVENVRPSPDMPTLREAQENLAKTTEQMRQEADAYLDEQAKFETTEDASEAVATEVQNQLGKIGTFNAKYNRAAGELTSAFYSTLGHKLGITAKEAFDRYPIQITDEKQEGGVGYNQALNTASHAPFFKAIDDVVSGNTPKGHITMGTTPNVLKILGVPDAKISISGAVIEKVMAQALGLPRGDHTNIHNLAPETLRQLPEQINDPVAIFKSGENATQNGFVVLTELNEIDAVSGKNKPVVAALHIKQNKKGLDVINIASVYGRSKSQLQRALDNDLLYWHKEKGQQFLNTVELQLPRGFTSDADLSKTNIKTNEDLESSIKRNYKQTNGGTRYDQVLPDAMPDGMIEGDGNTLVDLYNGIKIPYVDSVLLSYSNSKLAVDAPHYTRFSHSLSVTELQHIKRRHGDRSKEKDRNGQIGLTDEDILRIPDVFNNYDAVYPDYALSDKNLQLTGFLKKYEDGVLWYVVERQNKRKNLSGLSLRKYPPATDAQTIERLNAANPTSKNDKGHRSILEQQEDNYKQTNGSTSYDQVLPDALPKGMISSNGQEAAKIYTEYSNNHQDWAVKSILLGKVGNFSQSDLTKYNRYSHSIYTSELMHIRKNHGDEKKENARGQLPVLASDIARIEDIILNHDAFIPDAGMSKNKKPTIGYVKKYDDGVLVYVEEVREGRLDLSGLSMRKHPATSDINVLVKHNSHTPNVLNDGGHRSILDQQEDNYKQTNAGKRGSITFNVGQDGSNIVLSKNADFSTFVHELGHHFLEMNMQLAMSPDAPVQIRQDMETVLKWAKSDFTDIGEWDFFSDAEKTEVHEKFAESFEQYVFTGKAPSIDLKQVFTRFRQFMIAVYRNVEKFLGINDRSELNPDITGVMDRMLASESAIKEAEAAYNLEMLIQQDDAMRLGISPKDYDEMRQDHEIATELAINTLEQKTLQNLSWYQKQRSKYLRTLQREANKKREAVRKEMAKEVQQEPIYQAMAFLRQPLDPNPKSDLKKVQPEQDHLFEAIAKLGGLDADQVESTWGVDQPASIKSGVGNQPVVRSSKSKVKGLSIEEMAERLVEFGYLSKDENGKFDPRELEDKFSEQLIGNKQYSNQIDAELLGYAQDMDMLQQYAEGLVTKGKLSLDWIESKYGKDSEIYQRISKGAYGFAQRKGDNPDLIAEMFGYESGDALIRDLLSSPTPKQRIDQLTDERMAVQFSEFYDPQSIVEAVESALHNDIRARMLSAEMAALNGLLGRRSALNEAAKTIARDMIQRQKIKDIRPHVRAQDDARLGRMANEAFRKGNTVEAARHKRNQLVQFFATKYSYDAKDQVQKSLDLVKKVFGNNEKLAKSRDFDMVTAARGILGKYGLGRESTNYEQQLELIRQYDPITYAEIQNIGALPENQDYKNLTLEQFNAVMAAVETLWHRSRENKIWHTSNEAFEREQVREELIQQSGGKKSVEKIQQDLLGRNKTAELKAKFMELGASAKRVDQVVTWLDAGVSGKYREYLINPMQDALSKYRIEKTKMLDDVVNIFEGFGKLNNSKIAAPELNNYTFVGKQALLHAILHTGNTSNKERLVIGYGWGSRLEDGSVDFSAWDQFFNRMIAEGTITKTDMDTLQKMWDLFDRYKEQAQFTHKKINGRYFDELPTTPIMTPFGEYKGGYVPAAYDRIRSNEQDRIQDKNLAENNLQALDIATTGANFTKSRADRYSDMLELDLSRLPSHLDKELRYIHLELQIRQIGRLLLNKDFRNELERILPFATKQIFNPWLKAIANQSVDESSGIQILDNVFNALRRNTGIAIMAGNLKNAVEQLTGFTQVAVAVPPKLLIKAQADFFKSVIARQSMAEQIMELSDFMKTRWDRAADEYRYAVDEIIFQKNAYQTVKDFTMKHAYVLQTTIQRPMEVISWQAAFNHYTEKGLNQYDAVHAADAVIRQYMNDMSPEGISNLERGTPAKRMFLMFYNWFNMVWNTANTEVKLALEASNGRWVGASPRLAYVALMMISIPAMLSELIGVLFAGGLEDSDDDGEKWDDLSAKLALSQFKMLSAFVPYAGNVANAAISHTDDNVMNDRYTASPVFSVGESGLSLIQHAKRAADQDKEMNQGKAAKDLLNTATLTTGIPFAVLGKPSGYWLSIAQGKKEAPDSIYDAARGTITGKHAPAD